MRFFNGLGCVALGLLLATTTSDAKWSHGHRQTSTYWSSNNHISAQPPAFKSTHILWKHTDGRLATWDMVGTGLFNSSLIQIPDSEVLGFWGDTFIQRQHEKVFISGRALTARSSIGAQNMNFIGLAEVTGDQHWDILWSYRYYLIVWEMQGTNFVREHIVSGPDRMSSSARIKVLADFTGDNLPDLIWQDASGRLLLTSVHRLRYPNSILLDGAKPANLQWNLCGVGDFNFDGKPDLLWHHQDGRLATWFMNGATKIATSPLRNAQPVGHGWKILDTQLRIVMPNVFIQNPPIRIIPIPPIPPLPLPPYPNGSILNDSTIRTGGSVIVVVTPRRVMASPILRYPR